MHSIRSRLAGFCVLAALAVALGIDSAATAGTVLYRWVDTDGIVHYSDRPAPGAEKVQIASAQTYKSTPTSGSSRRVANLPAPPKYSRVEITRPTNGQSFVDSGGHVDAAAAVEPGLAGGHQLWFLLDGTRQPDPAGSGLATSFEVPRGTHSLAAVITDELGHEILTSAAVTFYVLQHSIATPPRGPALTPKKP
jgi:uncharacterized protein DUF4124